MNHQLTLEQRRSIRRPFIGTFIHAGRGITDRGATVTHSTPIMIVKGNSSPKVKGLGYWKTSFSNGRGFRRTLYTPSTLRIEVGEKYLRK